ncbi:hypothetical protein K435DRAFT_962139 [Dendrothele bispora CBS 962.96]|uniref:Uncharacterized protein n=1 Tax=Dendrothele bispora (strain CBS 962.96) TaxID=1314807 RepID=A0A4S8MMA5_DENBC|nr:hypothetical protein K435DRAFT_962139 [Dendrothele bispora CBS 962.96]
MSATTTTATSVVLYPTPPPTSNTLTSLQRSHLMRSTKKLERVLGYTPRFMDSMPPSPSYLDWSDDEDSYYRPSSRSGGSTTTTTTTKTTSTSRTKRSSSSILRPPSSRSIRSTKSSSSSRSSSLSSSSYDDCHYWSDTDSVTGNGIRSNNSKNPPLLRLALASHPSVKDIKISRSLSGSPFASSSSSSASSASDSEEDLRFTLRPRHSRTNRDSLLLSPAFHIPSASTTRREKMERLRKRLGEGVPVELVFPPSPFDEESDSENDNHINIAQPAPAPAYPIPPVPASATARPSSRTNNNNNGGVSNARDSLISLTTPHHANRVHRIKRKPVPKLHLDSSSSPSVVARDEKNEEDEFEPPVPALPLHWKLPKQTKQLKVEIEIEDVDVDDDVVKRLSLILESPLEESPLEPEGLWSTTPTTTTTATTTDTMAKKRKRFSRNITSEWFSEDEHEHEQGHAFGGEMVTFEEYMRMVELEFGTEN